MSMPLVIKQKEVSIEGCNLENIGQENQETWDPNSSWWISRGGASFSVGVSMGMSYGPALPIPSLLLPGAEKGAGIPGLQSPTCELRQHPSFPCFSDEYTHFTTNRIPAAHRPPPSWHTLKNVPPRSRGLTKSILPLKFYQKYPFHCFHHCKSHTYLYLSQRKYK